MTTTICQTIFEAYEAAKKAIGTLQEIEISADCYCECLECLPPIYGAPSETKCGRFWVGEPWDSTPAGETSLECWQVRGEDRYMCRISLIVRRA